MPRLREEDPKQNNGSMDQDGQIRIVKRESRRSHFRREVLLGILGGTFVLVAFLITALLMKDYTDRKVAESSSLLIREANSFSEFERYVYSRESFRRIYDDFTIHMAGVAASEEAFYYDDFDQLTSGILLDSEGSILAPAEILKGAGTAFIRVMHDGEESIHEGTILGVDEPSGVALIRVPALGRPETPRLDDGGGSHAETMIHMGMPKGDPEQGSLTLSGIQVPESSYAVKNGNQETSLQIFSLHSPVNAQMDGGAVLDVNGYLSGMVSLELSKKLKFYPFAAVISVEELKEIVERINTGEHKVLSLGVTGNIVRNEDIPGLGFYVLDVVPGSTAARGNIQPTDIIITINGEPMTERRTIDSYLIGRRVGDALAVEVLRGSSRVILRVRIH